MLVEKFHDSVGKGVSGRIAEIIFRDWAVAVRRLRRAVHGLAAGEDQPRELSMNRRLEHVGHAKDVDARRKRSILVHQRSHHVGEVDGVRDVGMLVKDGHHVAKIADIHGYGVEFGRATSRSVQVCDGLRVQRIIGRNGRDTASQEITNHPLANEAEAAGYEKLHALTFSLFAKNELLTDCRNSPSAAASIKCRPTASGSSENARNDGVPKTMAECSRVWRICRP